MAARRKREPRERYGAFNLADRVFDAYQTKQKEDLAELLTRISHRVAKIYSVFHPGENLVKA